MKSEQTGDKVSVSVADMQQWLEALEQSFPDTPYHAQRDAAIDSIRAEIAAPVQPLPDFNKLMELVTDFGVENLRVGSYEACLLLGMGDHWKASMVREKRQEARERLAKALGDICWSAAPALGTDGGRT